MWLLSPDDRQLLLPASSVRVYALSAAGEFSPADLNPWGWWRADQGIVETGGMVDSWTSIEGNSRQLVGTTTQRPAYSLTSLNGLPALTFDGSNDFMRMASGLSAAEANLSIVLVYQVLTVANKYYVGVVETGSGYGAGQDWLVLNMGASPFKWTTRVSAAGGNSDVTSAANADTLAHVQDFVFAGGSKVSLATDGTVHGDDTTSIPATIALDGFVEIGAFRGTIANPTLPAHVRIAELIIFRTALSDSQRESLRSYANGRYALY